MTVHEDDVNAEHTDLDILESDLLLELCKAAGVTYEVPKINVEGRVVLIVEGNRFLDYLENSKPEDLVAVTKTDLFSISKAERLKEIVKGFRSKVKSDGGLHLAIRRTA